MNTDFYRKTLVGYELVKFKGNRNTVYIRKTRNAVKTCHYGITPYLNNVTANLVTGETADHFIHGAIWLKHSLYNQF